MLYKIMFYGSFRWELVIGDFLLVVLHTKSIIPSICGACLEVVFGVNKE